MKIFPQTITELINQLATEVFVEQPRLHQVCELFGILINNHHWVSSWMQGCYAPIMLASMSFVRMLVWCHIRMRRRAESRLQHSSLACSARDCCSQRSNTARNNRQSAADPPWRGFDCTFQLSDQSMLFLAATCLPARSHGRLIKWPRWSRLQVALWACRRASNV